jgi:predicted PurR-regulated permease PerM
MPNWNPAVARRAGSEQADAPDGIAQQLAWLALATLTVVAVAGVVLIAFHLRLVLAVLFLGIVVGVTSAPVADYFARWKVPRAVSVLGIYSALAALLGLFLWYAVPEVTSEVERFLEDSDGFEERYQAAEDEYNLPPLEDVREYARDTARSLAPTAARQVFALASGLVYIATILVVALVFTTVKESAKELVLSLLPPQARARTDEVSALVGRRMRRFVVGEFISMAIVGVATYIGLVALGVPFPFLLAVIAFFLELLPILGPWLSAVPAIALALSESVELAIAVAVFYLVLQQVESNVILPMVQRRQTEMPALVVLSAVLLGGAAMGILGALVALPLAVIVHTVVMEVVVPWRQARVAGDTPEA